MIKSEILLRAHGPAGEVTASFRFGFDQKIERVEFDAHADLETQEMQAWLAPWLAGLSLPEAYETVAEATLQAFPNRPAWWAELSQEVVRQALYLTHPKVQTGSTDRIVCRCHKVSEATLKATLSVNPGMDWSSLSQQTRAGTGCGSCVPELMQLAEKAAPPARFWHGEPHAHWATKTQAALESWRERARFPWVAQKTFIVTSFKDGVVTVRIPEGLTSDQEWELVQALTDYFAEGFPVPLMVFLDFALL